MILHVFCLLLLFSILYKVLSPCSAHHSTEHGTRARSVSTFYQEFLLSVRVFKKSVSFSVQRCRRLVISALKISAQTAAAACSCACPVHRRRAGGQGARASAWLLARATPRCMRGSHSTMRINDACAAWLSRCRAARADGGTRARSEATQITCPSSTARDLVLQIRLMQIYLSVGPVCRLVVSSLQTRSRDESPNSSYPIILYRRVGTSSEQAWHAVGVTASPEEHEDMPRGGVK